MGVRMIHGGAGGKGQDEDAVVSAGLCVGETGNRRRVERSQQDKRTSKAWTGQARGWVAKGTPYLYQMIMVS